MARSAALLPLRVSPCVLRDSVVGRHLMGLMGRDIGNGNRGRTTRRLYPGPVPPVQRQCRNRTSASPAYQGARRARPVLVPVQGRPRPTRAHRRQRSAVPHPRPAPGYSPGLQGTRDPPPHASHAFAASKTGTRVLRTRADYCAAGSPGSRAAGPHPELASEYHRGLRGTRALILGATHPCARPRSRSHVPRTPVAHPIAGQRVSPRSSATAALRWSEACSAGRAVSRSA
jgi:hypothetical protein